MKRFTPYLSFVLLVSLLCKMGMANTEKQFHAVAVAHPPFTMKDTPEHGMSWELCKAALEIQGYEVSVDFAPWARAYSAARDGEYDGVLIAYWTQARSKLFVYPSQPIAVVSTGFFKNKARKDIRYTGNLRELSALDIGVERYASMGEEFDRADYLKKIFVNESSQLLKMVYLGHIDLGVAGFEYSRANLKKIENSDDYEGISNRIEFMQPPLARRPLYLMISKKAPDYMEKLKDLDVGFEKIRANGIFRKILEKYDISPAEYFSVD